MMDPELARIVDSKITKLNPDLARGLATRHLPMAEAWVDSIFRAVAKGFPPDLVYVKGERCDPQGAFNQITKKRNGSKRFYDVARSQLYTMVYTFKYRGEEIKRYLHLPFVDEGGVIYLGGPRFVISPVLSDRTISVPDQYTIFIRFNRGKVTFERLYVHFLANGQSETESLVHGKIYNTSSKNQQPKPIIKGAHSLVHYLFCKYGLEETFKRFTGAVPVIGLPDTVNKESYPPEDWVICETIGLKPRTVGDKVWRASQLRMAIRRKDYTPTMKSFVAGFFYILDHFPIRIERDFKWVNTTRMWRILMGHLILGSSYGEGHLHDNITDHIHSLDEYVDEIMRIRFQEIGVPVEDIYQFFGILIDKFNDWLKEGGDKINSLYGKELAVLYYLLEDVLIAINTFYFKLTASAQSKKELGKELRREDIEDLMNKYLRPGTIYKITKGHGEVSTTTTSGDNMALKLTSMMVPQAKSSRRPGRGDSGSGTSISKVLHFSTAEIGGYANMPKTDPSGHSRVNLFAHMSPKGVMLQNPALNDIREKTEPMIKRL